MTDFTNITNALETLVNEIRGTAANLLGTANSQRKQLLELRKAMYENQRDLMTFADIVGGAAESFSAVEDACFDVADKVSTLVEEELIMVPECDYEDFVGFCDVCGATISENDEFAEEDGLMCVDCLPTDNNDESAENTEEIAQ